MPLLDQMRLMLERSCLAKLAGSGEIDLPTQGLRGRWHSCTPHRWPRKELAAALLQSRAGTCLGRAPTNLTNANGHITHREESPVRTYFFLECIKMHEIEIGDVFKNPQRQLQMSIAQHASH